MQNLLLVYAFKDYQYDATNVLRKSYTPQTLRKDIETMNSNTKNKLLPFWPVSHLDHVTCTSHPIGRLLKGSDDIIKTLVAMSSHFHGLNSI